MKQMLNTLNISDFINKCTNCIHNTYHTVLSDDEDVGVVYKNKSSQNHLCKPFMAT